MEIVAVRLVPICDFCASEEVVVAYPIEDFIIPEFCWDSKGAFAACRVCMGLIESGQALTLEKRAFETFFQNREGLLSKEICFMFIRRLHGEFWKRLLKI